MASVAQDQRTSVFERLVLGLAVLALLLGLVGYYYLGAQPQVLRVLAVLAGGGLALALAYRTGPGRRGWEFIGAARQEIRRMVWPTRKEAVQVTLAVAAAVVLMGVLLWIFDWIVSRAVGFIIGLEG